MGSISPPGAGSSVGIEAVKEEWSGNPESPCQSNYLSADLFASRCQPLCKEGRTAAFSQARVWGLVPDLFFLHYEEDGSLRPRGNQGPDSPQTSLPKKQIGKVEL